MKYFYIVAGLIIYMCIGSVYAWSLFRKPLEQLLNISSTQSGLPYTLLLLLFSFTMPFGGQILQKFGIIKTIMPGALMLSTGLILSGFLKSITAISILYGVVGGIGVGLIYGVPVAVVAKWFPEKKGTYMGITLAGFGLSPFVTAHLSKRLLDLYGPFDTFKILGVIYFLVITIFSLILKMPQKEEISTGNNTQQHLRELTSKEMLKTKEFYGLWLCFTIGSTIGLTMISITSPFAQEVVKVKSSQAAFFVGIFSVFNGLGRPLFGFLVDKIRSFLTIIILFLIIIISSILGFFIKEDAVLLFFIVFALFYLILGGWLSTAPASTSWFFGTKNYASNYGIVFTAYGVGAFLGNMISGSLKDILGSYYYIFYPTLFLGFLGILISILTLRNVKTSTL
ncbi:MAG: OFA family MFS transporter [Endomicrobia bacterium]|nr:OFA family MFS transporter [Endomicrobiia bacterium]